jgi:hypothetical protein
MCLMSLEVRKCKQVFDLMGRLNACTERRLLLCTCVPAACQVMRESAVRSRLCGC